MLFGRRKNTELLELWDPDDSEGLAKLIQTLCERAELRDLGVYRLTQDDWLVQELVENNQKLDQVLPARSKIREQGRPSDIVATAAGVLAPLSLQDNTVQELEQDSTDFSSLDQELPPRLRMRKQWRISQVLKVPYPGMVVAPLSVKDKCVGLMLAPFSPVTNKRKASRLVFEAAPLVARALRTSLNISERDTRIQKSARQADAGRTAVGGAISIAGLIQILMAQCARSIGFDAALFCEVSERDAILTRFSWQLPEALADSTQDLRNRLLKIDRLGTELFVTTAESEKLEKLGIRSVLALPLGSDSNGILALISSAFSQTASSDDLATLRAYADQLNTVLQREDTFKAFERAYLETLLTTVTAIELSRPELRGHHGRVTTLTEKIAEHLSLSLKRKSRLCLAARLHDVGLLGGAEATVNTALEFQHPDIGTSMVSPLPDGEVIGRIISEHHETFEGFGFPSSLSGEEISLEGGILALAEFIVERTTASAIAPADSLQNTALVVGKEVEHRFSSTLAKAGMEVLSHEVESPFIGASCVSRKSCSQDLCAKCDAARSDSPCWEIAQASRLCAQHGDSSCEGCYIWRTWGPGKAT